MQNPGTNDKENSEFIKISCRNSACIAGPQDLWKGRTSKELLVKQVIFVTKISGNV